MTARTRKIAGWLALALWSTGTIAVAGTASSIPLSGPGIAPPGFQQLCMSQPGECGLLQRPATGTSGSGFSGRFDWGPVFANSNTNHRSRQSAHAISERLQINTPRLAVDAGSLAQLEQINRRVNQTSRVRGEQPGQDLWQRAGLTGLGDCEDFALEKRAQLISDGVPQSVLSLATAQIPDGQMHAVLIVRTSLGDYVMDNRYDRMLPWHSLPYRWSMVQSPVSPLNWYRAAALD